MRNYKTSFNVKTDITVKNKFTSDELYGTIINEREIEGKSFWVFVESIRPGSKLLAKDSWLISNSKKKVDIGRGIL